MRDPNEIRESCAIRTVHSRELLERTGVETKLRLQFTAKALCSENPTIRPLYAYSAKLKEWRTEVRAARQAYNRAVTCSRCKVADATKTMVTIGSNTS